MEENKETMDSPVIDINNENVEQTTEPVGNEQVVNNEIVIPSMETPVEQPMTTPEVFSEEPVVGESPSTPATQVEVDTMEDVIIDNNVPEAVVTPTVEVDDMTNIETPSEEPNVSELQTTTQEGVLETNVEGTPTNIEETRTTIDESNEVVAPQEQNLYAEQDVNEENVVVESSVEQPVEGQPDVQPQETSQVEAQPEEITPGPTPNEIPSDILGAPEPQVVGKLRKPGEKGIIIVAVIFVLLALVAWQLPNIKTFLETGKLPWQKETEKPTTPAEEIPAVDEEGYILVGGTGEFKDEDIKVSDIKIVGDEIEVSLKLENAEFDITKAKYQLSVFDDNKELLETIDLETTKILSTTERIPVAFSLLDSTKTKFVKVGIAEETKPEEIPEITLVDNKLTCKKENYTITYSFTENLLKSISVVYDYKNEDTKAVEEEYKKYDAKQLFKEDGVTKEAFSGATQVLYYETYDLSIYQVTDNSEDYVYALDTPAKNVSYYNTTNSYVCE